MNRRKGVPCGCDADPCGCSPKNHCVKAINNASPDPNGDFTIAAGDNVTITEVQNGIEITAAGGSAEDAVKSVNNLLPDAQGNVNVNVGVLTVNNQTPDAQGNIDIKTINNTSLLGSGDIAVQTPLTAGTDYQVPLVSGTNIKTINNTSLLGSGDITITTNDAVKSIEVQSEGTVLPDANGKITILVGTNMDIITYPSVHQIALISTATALTKKSHTLTAANWNNNQLTVIETEITATNDVFVSPDPSDWSDYNAAGIRAVSQGTGTLTFECDTTPATDIGVNLVIGRLNV